MTPALLVLMALAADPSPEPDDAAADLKRMQGAWSVVEVRGKNAAAVAGPSKTMRFVFEKDTLRFELEGVSRPAAKIKLAIRRGVGEFDMSGGDGGPAGLGLYKFDKGRLVLCGGQPGGPRPKKFDDPDADVVVLKRVGK